MKNIFHKEAYDELIQRLDKLNPNSRREWGTMDAAQMMAHCSACIDMATGKVKPPRSFMGRVLGGFFKKDYISEKPFGKGSPTANELKMTDAKEFAEEKELLREKITEFHQGGPAKCTTHPHTFFGPLTTEEWSVSQYKHLDHHFRQFGV